MAFGTIYLTYHAPTPSIGGMDANLIELAGMSDDDARAYLERIRWPHGPVCPRCGGSEATKLQGKSTRPGVYKCRTKGCRKPFTVTVGTIFEGSHVPLRKWLLAFHLVCSSKKGVSALQLKRNLGLGSYKTAWHMAHRIRYAMQQEPLAGMLRGIVEIDETYVGGKPRRGTGPHPTGRATKKAPVIALVQRGGEARAMARQKLTRGSHLRQTILENVDRSARVMTDSAADFKGLGRHFASHETTNHLRGEYARGDVNSNSAESFFALVKRSVYGIHHHVSKAHLDRYLTERAFMWSNRRLSDEQRTTAALKATEGKRLMYRETLSR